MGIKKYNTKPDSSIISKDFNGYIHYVDSFSIEIINKEDCSIDYLTALLFTSVPKWVRLLLDMRDFIVKPFGLTTGIVPEQRTLDKSIRYNRGDRAVYFLVIDRSESEIVMDEDDKHLYLRTSLFVRNNSNSNHQSLYLTTIVQFHNIWGKIYFAPVKPLHKLIMKRLLINFLKTIQNNNC